MSLVEYIEHREQAWEEFLGVLNELIQQPTEKQYVLHRMVAPTQLKVADLTALSYNRWVVQMYASEVIETFGGQQIIEKDLLSVGMAKEMAGIGR